MIVTDVDRIDALLPQTQCRKCGFQGCRPYAEALVAGVAAINRCPPGGEIGIQKLADALSVPVMALDLECGVERPLMLAVIDESVCIGCTKCLPPCPVDAILGASKQMHTVIAELCTGCELCLPACPVNCITMQPAPDPQWSTTQADAARRRYLTRNGRLARQEADKQARLQRQKQMLAK
jgi:electron transport complex protein RnfB